MRKDKQADDSGRSHERKFMNVNPAVITVAMLSAIVLAGCLHEGGNHNGGLADPYSLFLTEEELPAGLMQCDHAGELLGIEMESNPGVHPYGSEQPADWSGTQYAHVVGPGPVCSEEDYYVFVTIEQIEDSRDFDLNREFQIENTPPCEASETDHWTTTKRFSRMVGDDRDQVWVTVWEHARTHEFNTSEELEENLRAAENHRMEVYTALNEKHPHWWLLCTP